MRVTFPPGFDGRNRRGESFAKQKDGGVFQLEREPFGGSISASVHFGGSNPA
jgi:hypothetical protein